MLKYKQSDAWHLERSQSAAGSARPQSAQRASAMRDEKLREAAELHMHCGNLLKYCEILVSLGEWQQALSVAPGVSREFWQDVSRRYINFTLKNGGDVSTVLPYAIASGMFEEVLQTLLDQHRTADGLLLVQIGIERCPPSSDAPNEAAKGIETKKPKTEPSPSEASLVALQRRFTDQNASFHLRNGSPISAACCYMAAEQPVKAVCALVRGYELELAITLSRYILANFARIRDKVCRNNSGDQALDFETRLLRIIEFAAEMLAMRCLNVRNPHLAVDMLLNFKCSETALLRICSMSALILPQPSLSETSEQQNRMALLLKRARLPDGDECLRLASSMESNNGTAAVIKCVQYYFVSNKPSEGLKIGLKYALQIMSREEWSVSDVFDLVRTLGTIRTDVLQEEGNVNLKLILLTLSAYIGALVAMRRLYLTIVSPLFDCCMSLLKQPPQPLDGISLPLDQMTIQAEKNSWIRRMMSNSTRQCLSSGDDVTYEKLMRKVGVESPASFPIGVGIFSTTGCHLPSHSDTRRCFFTGQPIKGIPFTLEDGESTISHCDALMWSTVNYFSPLKTGVRVNPF